MRRVAGALTMILLGGAVSGAQADEIDLTGHWQVNMDCGFYATATSYLNLETDVVTGEVTAVAADGCGTVQLPGSIEPIASCGLTAGSNLGRIAGTVFELPASGSQRSEAVFDPFFYPLIDCTVERLFVDSRFDATVFTDASGNAVRLSGSVSNQNIEFHDPSGATCYAFPSPPECSFEARRNDVAVGTDVATEPRAGTTLTFDTVTAPGTVSVTPLTAPDGNVPSNFRVYAPDAPVPIFYDIHTTATVTGPITTCFAYPDDDDDGVVDGTSPYVYEGALRFLHAEDGEFVDRTSLLDPENNVLCGETTSFSQVTIGAAQGDVPWQDHPLAHAKLLVKRSATGTEKVVFLAKDPDWIFPEPGSVNDPSTAGSNFEIFAHGESTVDANDLGTRWRHVSANKYKLLANASGARVKLVRGRLLKIKMRHTGLALTAPQGSMAVRFTTGLVRQCAYFDPQYVRRDRPGRFLAKRGDAPPLADCAATTLGGVGSPSGAFLE